MGITRLQLYQDAALHCGEPLLASLTEENELRRLLDHVWATGWVKDCLEQGAWQFAMRTVQIEVDQDFVEQTFGYENAFEKPTDWVRTEALSADERFRDPLRGYDDQATHWFADVDQLYVKFISQDSLYGADLSQWSPSFGRYAAAYGASRIVGRLSGKSEQALLLNGPPGRPEMGLVTLLLNTAQSLSARTQSTKFITQGNWSRARGGRSTRDGGPTGRLI